MALYLKRSVYTKNASKRFEALLLKRWVSWIVYTKTQRFVPCSYGVFRPLFSS